MSEIIQPITKEQFELLCELEPLFKSAKLVDGTIIFEGPMPDFKIDSANQAIAYVTGISL